LCINKDTNTTFSDDECRRNVPVVDGDEVIILEEWRLVFGTVPSLSLSILHTHIHRHTHAHAHTIQMNVLL